MVVEVSKDWDELSERESNELIAKLSLESDAVEELYKQGKITMGERDRRIMEIWKPFGVGSGFIKHLEDFIMEAANYRISDRKRQSYRYFEYRAEIEWKVIKETDWIGVFRNCTWLKPPSEEDYEAVEILTDFKLTEWSGFLSMVIGRFFNEDMHETDACQLIYAHYRLLRDEIARRGLDYPYKDCLEELKEKAQNIEKYEEFETKLERARYHGKPCPYCDSENVGSYNKLQYYCRDCRKRWRKR